MEVFATLGLIVLAAMAVPIILLFAGLTFDLAVLLYVMIARKGIRKG